MSLKRTSTGKRCLVAREARRQSRIAAASPFEREEQAFVDAIAERNSE
jgi:hypothetical protein